MSSEPFGYGSR